MDVAYSLQHLKRHDKAAAEFSDVVERWPDHLPALIGLGHAFRHAGRSGEAVAAFECILRSDPYHPAAREQVVQIFLELGRWEDAISTLQDVISHDRKAVYYVQLARALKQTRRTEQAREAYVTATELEPTNIGIKIELGHFLREENRLDEARNFLEKALRYKPSQKYLKF